MPQNSANVKLGPDGQAKLEKMRLLRTRIDKAFERLPFDPDGNDLKVLAKEIFEPSGSLRDESANIVRAASVPTVTEPDSSSVSGSEERDGELPADPGPGEDDGEALVSVRPDPRPYAG